MLRTDVMTVISDMHPRLSASISIADSTALGIQHPRIYAITCLAYLAFSLLAGFTARLRKPGYELQTVTQILTDIAAITLAGNTTMTQLLLKVNPRYIRRSPYVPASNIYPPLQAVELGLDLGPHAAALVYPQVSSYVGGDIVAGVMGSGMYRTERLTLFMDIGTNAEIVVGNKDWMACAACSAGPALEGGNIEFGMRAAKGAIEDFSIDPTTLEPMILTIGNVRPKGICGSGLITTVAVMFEMGVINNLGKFDRDLDTPRIREQDNVYEYVLAWADETQVARDIVLTEIYIENLIRAKEAVGPDDAGSVDDVISPLMSELEGLEP